MKSLSYEVYLKNQECIHGNTDKIKQEIGRWESKVTGTDVQGTSIIRKCRNFLMIHSLSIDIEKIPRSRLMLYQKDRNRLPEIHSITNKSIDTLGCLPRSKHSVEQTYLYTLKSPERKKNNKLSAYVYGCFYFSKISPFGSRSF